MRAVANKANTMCTANEGKLQTRRPFVDRKGAASMQLVMATAIAIPIAGGLLFLGFRICRYVFSVLSGSLTMPFV